MDMVYTYRYSNIIYLGHILEDTLDLQDLVEVRLHPVAPVHHLVAVASNLEAFSGLVETDDGDVRQPHLRGWLIRD